MGLGVWFWLLADVLTGKTDVCFSPKTGHWEPSQISICNEAGVPGGNFAATMIWRSLPAADFYALSASISSKKALAVRKASTPAGTPA
jgi:hypothetical protein